MAYATELELDMRLLWVQALRDVVRTEPVLDSESQERIRAALGRLEI